MRIEINKECSYLKKTFVGKIYEDETGEFYPFWLEMELNIKDPEDIHIGIEWWNKSTPRNVKKVESDIINKFKEQQYDTGN